MIAIQGKIPLRTNASINRAYAVACMKRGMKPADVAKEWPEVWKLGSDGRIGQRYNSCYVADPDLLDITRMISRESVADVLRARGLRPLGSKE